MSRVQRVHSFAELPATPFAHGVNALCWERTLTGDFATVAQLLAATGPALRGDTDESDEGIVTIQPSTLRDLLSGRAPHLAALPVGALTAPVRSAIETLLSDLQLLREQQRDPVLNLIHAYPHDTGGGPVPTDVFSFHADSAPIPADTWLCTYHGPPSEGLRNEDAVRKVDVPDIRAELLRLHGGPDDAAFAEFLSENHYDLHYAAAGGAVPYSFGRFNLWRIACAYPDAPVPPCIHRAPENPEGETRLLLIS